MTTPTAPVACAFCTMPNGQHDAPCPYEGKEPARRMTAERLEEIRRYTEGDYYRDTSIIKELLAHIDRLQAPVGDGEEMVYVKSVRTLVPPKAISVVEALAAKLAAAIRSASEE